jgi:hypothetical protein
MRTIFLAIALSLFVAWAKADVTYEKGPIRVSEKGRLQTILGRRGDVTVHKITLIDRGDSGTFSEFVEDFFVDGVNVLRLSKIKGDYMIDCRSLGTGIVSLYYRGERGRPEKVVVGESERTAELFIIADNEIHTAVPDANRVSFLEHVEPARGMGSDSREPEAK